MEGAWLSFKTMAALQLTEDEEVHELARILKKQQGCAKFMGEVVEDIVEKKVEAKVFVDQWPSFTTVISQEFTPCLSELADIRIYTTDKQNIEPLLTSASLLQNTGTWQLIHFVASEECVEELSSHLLDLFKSHASTKGKQCAIVFDYKLLEPKPRPIEIAQKSLGEEFNIREIPQREAKFIAKYWIPGTLEYPLQYRIKYVEDVISKFGMMGIYSVENDKYPVSWIGRIPGGEIGLAYSLKDYRHNYFNLILRQEIASAFFPKLKSLFVAVQPSYSHQYESASLCVGYRRAIAIF